jgi:hypothetical protein
MLDFIKTLDLSAELKNDEIYYLFKTDSSETNLNFLSSLQKFKTNQEFLYHYTNQDCKSVMDIFYNISSIASKICKDEKNLFKNNKIEQYTSSVSKIIFLFLIIQKYNELLSQILMNTKKYIKKFYIDFQLQKNLKEIIKSCVNDLTCSSIITSRRNYSRRSTKEETKISLNKLSYICLLKNKQKEMNLNSNEDEYLFSQIETPKFDEELIDSIKENKGSKKELRNNEISIKKDSNKFFDSSLTLAKMKFILRPEFEEMKLLEKKKFQNNYQRKESKKIKKLDILNNKSHEINKKVLVKFLDTINNLYKEGKINSEIKKSMKKLIISDSKKIIDRFNNLNNNNKTFNNILMKENISSFLFILLKEL